MNEPAGEMSVPEVEESSTLDHALLESLFYNEMMMLKGSSPTSSHFLSQHFNEATQPPPPASPSKHLAHPSHVDPTTIAEKEMLQDFGVSANQAVLHPTTALKQPVSGSTSSIDTSWPPPASIAPAPTSQSQALHPHTSSHPVPIYPAPQPAPTQTVAVANGNAINSKRLPSLSVDTHQQPQDPHQQYATASLPEERAKQLVDQFATLASRLGIDLPDSVLQSLTMAAAQNEGLSPSFPAVPQQAVTEHTQTTPAASMNTTTTTTTPSHPGATPPLIMAPTVEELRKTAEEAIASVTKRRASDILPHSTSSEALATSGSMSKEAAKHNKRRKKPRLADCESRLAELKAENELLKRHLQNVSNKAHRFDQEKQEAGKRIHGLLEGQAGHEEMVDAVQEFSDMYSDYGKNRQQELSFHLEQLQRLVNPTNFTKMGLWTLGQNNINPKRNPIAGILQKELDITPQQGKKILDQSEKIRALCENLKECISLLAKLKALCEQKTQIFHDRMNKCREILTSKQVVKLIKWIDDHTQLLERVCPGWGTEHIHS